MLSRLFRAHGALCASRPWEVIIGTLTLVVCMMSMGLFAGNTKICGWNHHCKEMVEVKSSETLVLAITRCLAVIYVYLQFRKLRRLGSKYLLGIAGVFTVFSSFVFSIAVVKMLGSDLTGLNEALPFFLLLVDLSKAAALAKFALSSTSQDEVIDNIGRGMAILGPPLTLDALVSTLVIGVGTLSGVTGLETMCCFGCLSVIANYVAFMTFFPACLALVLEISRERNHGRPVWQLQQLTKVLKEEEEQKPNPVTQRVKIIMSAGLVLVHAQSRLLPLIFGGDEGNSVIRLDGTSDAFPSVEYKPDMPLWQFYIMKACHPSIDYTVTLVLGLLLAVKYIMFDTYIDDEVEQLIRRDGDKPAVMLDSHDGDGEEPITQAETNVTNWEQQKLQAQSQESGDIVSKMVSGPSFIIGGGDSSSEDEGIQTRASSMEAVETSDNGTQTDSRPPSPPPVGESRPLEECVAIMKGDEGPAALTDDEIKLLVTKRHIPAYKLESMLGNHVRGVKIRRQMLIEKLAKDDALDLLPFQHYDYKYVEGACCENVIGYMPVPVGVAGPLLLDGRTYQVPMATTEGCLVASTNRGCRAFSVSGGVTSSVIGNGMTRAPVVRFPTAKEASEVKIWLQDSDNFDLVAETFNSTSRFGRLERIQVVQAARHLYIRFVAFTGDAMGMNMVSKGTEKALNMLQDEHFHNMEIISLSGNLCTDKKPSAINWIEGRGKSIVAEAIIPANVVKTVLKTTVPALVDLNISKNLMGSAMAGSIGGYNAHSANIVTAIYIACGQDPAQNVCSSNCMTIMEATGFNGEDLYISCTMPSIEVGTIGGGTVLPPQKSCLQMLGVAGSNAVTPGDNAVRLAQIVCATVMAGELSLMSALAAGHLVKSHLTHNRSSLNMAQSNGKLGSVTDIRVKDTKEPGTCINKAA